MCNFVANKEGACPYVLVMNQTHYTINVGGQLMDLSRPVVMGILNLTPDSFYADSRMQTEDEVEARVRQILAEGAAIIDVGACSTRPGASFVSEAEEIRRLEWGLQVLRRVAPDAVVSVDTFRASVARRCVEAYGVQIVNDISGGDQDKAMFPTVADLGVPYVLTHNAQNEGDLLAGMLLYLGARVERLHALGVKDILLDPGFGFGKTLEENYLLMRRFADLSVLELPLLVGVSRKSMIYRLLDITPQEALNGTTVLHTLALMQGAAVLRVHDVRQAVETIKITQRVCSNLE